MPGCRRRQHFPRHGCCGQGFRPRDSRLHGHVGDGDECTCAAERAGEGRRRHACAVGDPDGERVEPYIRRRALRHLEKGRIVLFAAGPAIHIFTTDTAAALRAAEMGCDALFKGTSVDGIYTADPKKVADATRYDSVTFGKVLSDDLKVMDAAAVALCRDNNIPIVVFNIRQPGNLAEVLAGRGPRRSSRTGSKT